MQATVWTLLRRPLPDWYNLFPVMLGDNPEARGVFTTRWWEDYKNDVKALRDHRTSKMKIKRLIALPPDAVRTLNSYEALPKEDKTPPESLASYYVFHRPEGAFALAQDKPSKPTNGVQLLDGVTALLDAPEESTPPSAKVHLVGKFLGNAQPDGWRELVEHFQHEFHTGSGEHEFADEERVGGVYFKYLQTIPQKFAHYDDIFLIECGDMMFGIALCVEEDLDTGGIRILEPKDVIGFRDAFQSAWRDGSCHLSIRDFRGRLLYLVN